LRIAILSCFYPYRGGISQFNASIFGELGKRHIVKAFNFKRQYPEFLFPGKTQFVTDTDSAVPVESVSVLDTADPFSYGKTAREIAAWKPDLVVMRYWMSWFAPSLGYVARRLKKKGCKVVSILDNVVPHEPHFFDRPFTRYFLSGQSGCVVMCDEVAKDLLAIRSDLPYTILPHPLYTHFGEKMDRAEAERALGIRSGKKNLLFFGLIRQYKGLDILLEAFRQLGDDYQLIVAGEPYGSFEPYRKIIDSLPGKDRITLITEYIPDNEVSKYFSAADVTVLPYRSATQSGISSISYHFEVPMIVTAVGGLTETVGGRGTGLVAAEATPESVLHEIRRYFGEEEVREQCIRNIRREKERLSWSKFCSDLVEFAQSL
jgi:glycosyltransferase involved in cell wall biosynthesis